MNTKKAYVIGNNVSKSLSPTIFQYWFEKYKIKGEYGYIEIEEDFFDKKIESVLNEKNLCGLNITIPYKEKIIPHIQNPSGQKNPKTTMSIHALNVGAVNFVKKEDRTGGGWFADNPDYIGFQKSLKKNQKKEKAIVVGFGGASRAIIYSLVLQQFKEISVFNRGFEKLSSGLDDWKNKITTPKHQCNIISHKLEDLEKHTNNADLIINTTPSNVLGDLGVWNIGPNTTGLDIVYTPREGTGFLKHFSHNKRIGGIHMLIYQAAPCFKSWFGPEPEIDLGLYSALYSKMEENK